MNFSKNLFKEFVKPMGVSQRFFSRYYRFLKLPSHQLFEPVLSMLNLVPCLQIIDDCEVIVYPWLKLRRHYFKRVLTKFNHLVYMLLFEKSHLIPIHLHHQKRVIHNSQTLQKLNIRTQYSFDVFGTDSRDVYFMLCVQEVQILKGNCA